MTDGRLETALYSNRGTKQGHRRHAEPDWPAIHRELKRKHVTLLIIWDEYIAVNPGGYSYSRFCELYRAFEFRLPVTMRQTHVAGERLFLDYAGDGVPVVIDRLTGEIRMAQIFVAVLGASSFTYARATWTQTLADWIDAHTHAFAAIGGVPHLLVPDNTKAAVIKACLYDPLVNRTYAEMAAHYYSVHHRFARTDVDVRLTARTVEVFLQRREDRRAYAHKRQPQAYDRDGAYALQSSPLRQLDDRPHSPECARDRPGDGGAVRTDPGAEAASRAGLSRLSRHRPARRTLWGRPPRSGGGTRHRDRRAHLWLGQIHPRQQSRSSSRTKARRGWNADPARQYPWAALLQLGETILLNHPTLDQLHTLGLYGMAKAFAEIRASGEAESLGHSEWLGLLLDREASWRRDKRLAARLRYAKLRQQASIEDVDYRSPRGLDRALFQKLAEGNWIEAHDNLALTGPTGTGKSWLSSALGHKACRDNRSVLYHRVPKLFEDLALARGDGRHPRILRSLGRADLLILDDWGLEPLDAAARHDLLEILEERYGRRSTVITSQLPVDRWHEIIGDPTYADAILDRLVHNAHRIELAGESMRRTRGKQNQKA